MEQPDNSSESETREQLLKNVKKEVKQIMEESVTRKFVHEESSSVVSLCGAVECCLQHGLKKRALGLFKNSTTMALLQKVAKSFEPAAQLLKTLSELERNHENLRKSVDNASVTSLSSSSSSSSGHHYHHLVKKNNNKYLWIRIALYEKQLAKIVDYLVHNSSRYFEKEALMSDPVSGAILASLLVGPCALEFTQMKTVDHLWTDPPAKELMQRHRIHSTTGHHLPGVHSDSPKRLALQVHKTSSSTSEDCQRNIPFLAKEYVESLHQNSKSTLLYGKNNVIVQPKEDIEAMAGYLSLHQSQSNLVVKWTPNQLMNVSSEHTINENCQSDRSQYWNYALVMDLDDIVYLHCHQQPESGGTVVLVGQDGVQRPPIHFPKGGHLWAFLSCIENGLAPNGHLEPPLSYHREEDADYVFPNLLKKKIGGASNVISSLIGSMTDELTSAFNQSQSSSQNSNPTKGLTKQPQLSSKSSLADLFQNGDATVAPGNEDVATDSVFRIVMNCKTNIVSESIPEQDEKSKEGSSVSNDDALDYNSGSPLPGHRTAVRQLCDTMSSQILSRAFYGWLSHCRQLKTVRTHLSGLVHSTVEPPDMMAEVRKGLTREQWNSLMEGGAVKDEMLLHKLIYYGGCDPELRMEVWPFLLGHYKMESNEKDRAGINENVRKHYDTSVAEWSHVETIIKSQEKDKTLPAVATSRSLNSTGNLVGTDTQAAPVAKKKLPSEGGSTFMRKEPSLCSDVFDSVEGLEDVNNVTQNATTSTAICNTTTTAPAAGSASIVAAAISNDVVNTTAGNEASPTITTTNASSSSTSSLSSFFSSSSSSSAGQQQQQQDSTTTTTHPHHVSHHTHAKRMLEKSTKTSVGAKFTISDDTTSLDSSDSMKLDSVDSDNLVSSSDATNDDGISCIGDVNGSLCGVPYSTQLLENLALNVHRIDKDVHRCDRNHAYFSLQSNLNKLRNIMCTYVWNNMDMGYVQGMCDLAAPLLVILDDEPVVYSCFSQYMKKMSSNFPNGNAMDQHFGNMRSLIQIMDPELFEHMRQYGDYTHFYFCYRWFLLDFKRELVYSDVFRVWETIWSARRVCSPHFVLFIALALLEYYRDIIIDNRMDFTEIIKFFNELAERHNANEILNIARGLVGRLQELIENK